MTKVEVLADSTTRPPVVLASRGGFRVPQFIVIWQSDVPSVLGERRVATSFGGRVEPGIRHGGKDGRRLPSIPPRLGVLLFGYGRLNSRS